jgi:hypothetical protein
MSGEAQRHQEEKGGDLLPRALHGLSKQRVIGQQEVGWLGMEGQLRQQQEGHEEGLGEGQWQQQQQEGHGEGPWKGLGEDYWEGQWRQQQEGHEVVKTELCVAQEEMGLLEGGNEVAELILKHQIQQEEVLLQQLLWQRETRGQGAVQSGDYAARSAGIVRNEAGDTPSATVITGECLGVSGEGMLTLCADEDRLQEQKCEQGIQGEQGEQEGPQVEGLAEDQQQVTQLLHEGSCTAGSISQVDSYMAGWVTSAQTQQEELMMLPAEGKQSTDQVMMEPRTTKVPAAATAAAAAAAALPEASLQRLSSPARAQQRSDHCLMSPSRTLAKLSSGTSSRATVPPNPTAAGSTDTRCMRNPTKVMHRILKPPRAAAGEVAVGGLDGLGGLGGDGTSDTSHHSSLITTHHSAQVQVMTHQLQGQLQLKEKIISDLRQRVRQLTEAAADRDDDLTAMQQRLGSVQRQVENQGQLVGRVKELKGRVEVLEKDLVMLLEEREGLRGQLERLKVKVGTCTAMAAEWRCGN